MPPRRTPCRRCRRSPTLLILADARWGLALIFLNAAPFLRREWEDQDTAVRLVVVSVVSHAARYTEEATWTREAEPSASSSPDRTPGCEASSQRSRGTRWRKSCAPTRV